MPLRYPTPQDLVEALQTRGPGARGQLWELFEGPVARLVDELVRRHDLGDDREVLTRHALHAIETALRMRLAGSFAGTTWNSFRAAVLLQLAKLLYQPHGGTGARPGGPAAIPDSPLYLSDAYYRPCARLGNHFFGGDWYAGHVPDDGSLWVIVADVTGHGYFAYLLASALPAVWQRCWSAQPGQAPQPADLLAAMHELLADCLPEGIFLECTLVRLDEQGRATVSPAGGSRLLVGRKRRPADLVKLRGAWLGLRAPSPDEQHVLVLEHGDELLLATDGVFDQLEEYGPALLAGTPGALFEALRQRHEQSLASIPQKDDITLVLLRRREPVEGPVVLSLPLPGARFGVDDVPV